jgi:hypothetical protein
LSDPIKVDDRNFTFAIGSDVDSGQGVSRFSEGRDRQDRITDLVIQSDPDDPRPYRFEVGETYVLRMNFDGVPFETKTTILRSDAVPGSVPVVVFRGIDPQGRPFDIAWTPGVDVDNWGTAVRDGGRQPGFFTSDQDASSTYSQVCFCAGTQIDTPRGPVEVEDLRAGDNVLTLDSWAVPLRAVDRFKVPGTGSGAAVRISRGLLSATHDVRISQQHRVLVASPLAELWFASPEVLLPAVALVDAGLAALDPRPIQDYVHLLCDRHEVLFSSGLRLESLFLGAVALSRLDGSALSNTGIRHGQTARPVLRRAEGAALVARMLGGHRSVTPETAASTAPARRHRSS